MSYGFTEIDHLLGSAVDPQRGGEKYERLGFTVTPLSVIESLGVGNRMVLLEPLTANTANFVECMGIVDRARVPAAMAQLLEGSEGIRSMVLSGPDAGASYAQLKRDGFEFLPPLDLEREWSLPSGEILRPAFLVTLPAPAPLRFNFCQYSALAIGRRYVLLFRMSGWATPTASATSALRSRFHRLWRFVRFSFTAESTSSNVDKRWLWRRKRRAEALYGSSSQVARSVESSLARLLLRFLNTAFGTDRRHFVGSSRREGPAPPSALLRTTR